MDLFQFVCSQVGLDIRHDAKATAALDQDLEFVRSQTYDIEYPANMARSLIPIDTSVPSGAETFSYRQWDIYGMAEIIANYADDLPMVDTKAEKFAASVHSLGEAYQYSLQDLRRSAFYGEPLDARRAGVARRVMENGIDHIAAVGNAEAKLKGFTNHPNVTVLTAATDGTATEWVTGRATPKSPADIKGDLNTCTREVFTATKQIHQADTIALSTVEWSHISETQVGVENQDSILKTYLDNSPTVREVTPWYKLDTADAAGTGPRLVCYEKNPDVLQLVIPQEFEQLPPQARNLAFVVPCHARIGGVVVRYPLGMVYMDGI